MAVCRLRLSLPLKQTIRLVGWDQMDRCHSKLMVKLHKHFNIAAGITFYHVVSAVFIIFLMDNSLSSKKTL